MGKEWDGGDVAFRSETWANIGKTMYPGAWGFAFSSARGWHRMAVAIEDAGFVFHPTIFMLGWSYSSGFPKATRVDKQIEDPELAKDWSPYRYGGQALKPACEPLIVWQKPFEGRPIDNMVETGAGGINIDSGRIGGRWPANLILQHHPSCKIVGKSDESYQINRWEDDMHPFGNGAGNEFETEQVTSSSDVWECHEDCPVKKWNQDQETSKYFFNSGWQYEVQEQIDNPFLYYSKTSNTEKNAGLEERNPHPTTKPIALTKYMAGTLLPPDRYAPRRILVPFSGSGSEMIGAMLAGWEDVVGVELTPEYIPIAEARLSFWSGWKEKGFTDPATILKKEKTTKKLKKTNFTQGSIL